MGQVLQSVVWAVGYWMGVCGGGGGGRRLWLPGLLRRPQRPGLKGQQVMQDVVSSDGWCGAVGHCMGSKVVCVSWQWRESQKRSPGYHDVCGSQGWMQDRYGIQRWAGACTVAHLSHVRRNAPLHRNDCAWRSLSCSLPARPTHLAAPVPPAPAARTPARSPQSGTPRRRSRPGAAGRAAGPAASCPAAPRRPPAAGGRRLRASACASVCKHPGMQA